MVSIKDTVFTPSQIVHRVLTPLRTFESVVETIGNTRTQAGLHVKVRNDKRTYKKGLGVAREKIEALSLYRDVFRDEWNYDLHPRTNLEK